MKALFRRGPPSPSAPLPPASPFPTMESHRDDRTSATLPPGFRHRAFSFSRDHNGNTSPAMVISSPMQHVDKVSSIPDTFYNSRRRLQSGGIAFDEVLPSFVTNSNAAPPIPSPPISTASITTYALARPPLPIDTNQIYSTFPTSVSLSGQTAHLSMDDAAAIALAATPALYQDVPSTPTRTQRPSLRPRRGTNEVGLYTSHIDALVSPAKVSYREYVNTALRPQLAGRRAASMGDVRGNNDQLDIVGTRHQALHQSLAPTSAMPHSRVRSDQTRDVASVGLLAAAEITVRPRATSTSVPVKQSPRFRRPPLARAVHMHSESSHEYQRALGGAQAVHMGETTASSRNTTLQSTHLDAISTTTGVASREVPLNLTLPQAGISGSYPCTSSPSGTQTPGARTPGLSPSGSGSPFSMAPTYSDRWRDIRSKVPFPQDATSLRTILTPPLNPQMSAALQVDATRISLDKYDVTQDLTFVLRVQNIVADDVELVLVKTVESSETVYELKIKKKDPEGMRVRNGIIPYTYVPPFASPTSTSSPSSLYSSPVTTPTFELPYGHQHGSYFPMGPVGRSPRRNSLVSKPAASARSSHLMSRTPPCKVKQSISTSNSAKPTGGNSPGLNFSDHAMKLASAQATSPISPTFPKRSSGTAQSNQSDEDDDNDDDNDNSSVLAHYSYSAHATSRLAPAGVDKRASTDHSHGRSVFDSHDDDNVQEGEDETSDRDSTFPFGMKSYWSDTEAEDGTDGDVGEDESQVHSSDSMSGDSSPTGPETP